jgi:hypothetical protein
VLPTSIHLDPWRVNSPESHGILPAVRREAGRGPPRAGFVTREQFDTIRKRLPDELRAAMTVAYTFGWNKREVLDLKKRLYNSQDGPSGSSPPRKTKKRWVSFGLRGWAS